MANLSSKTGFTTAQARVTLANNGNTNIQDFSGFDAQNLTGFVYIDATNDKRSSVDVWVVKNGVGTYEIASADIAGDDLSGSPIVSFSMSGTTLVATLPNVTGFATAYIQYTLNSPPTSANTSVISAPSATASGSGEVSAIANDSFATDTTGWTGVTRVTSGSPLDPIVATAGSVSNTAMAETSTSGGYATISSLPSALRSKRLKVQFYYNTPATDVYRVSVYQGTTRLPLSTDSSGATTLPASVTGGLFTCYVDTLNAAAYTVNITRTSGSTGACTFTKIIFGPGQVNQGAGVSGAKSFSPNFSGVTYNTNAAFYYRVVEFAEVTIQITATLDATTTVSLPLTFDGFNIDTSRLGDRQALGVGNLRPASGASYTITPYYMAASSQIRFQIDLDGNDLDASNPTGIGGFDSGDRLSATFRIPIAEWTSSAISVGPGADVEYASNSDTSVSGTASVTTSVFGSTGSPTPSGTAAGIFKKRIRFQYPIQADDALMIEIQKGTGPWVSINNSYFLDGIEGYYMQNTASFGIGLDVTFINSTDIDVVFGKFYYNSGVNYGDNGSNWSGLSNCRWRVKKYKANTPVGIEYGFLDGRAQLYKAGQAPGLTTGAAIGAGYVGETTTSTISSTALSTPSVDQDITGASIMLTPGRWLVSYSVEYTYDTTATTATGDGGSVYCRITTSGNTLVPKSISSTFHRTNGTNQTFFATTMAKNLVIDVATATTYKLRGQYTDNAGTNACTMCAQGSDYNVFYAIRIA